jgi:hypothetical protein
MDISLSGNCTPAVARAEAAPWTRLRWIAATDRKR